MEILVEPFQSGSKQPRLMVIRICKGDKKFQYGEKDINIKLLV